MPHHIIFNDTRRFRPMVMPRRGLAGLGKEPQPVWRLVAGTNPAVESTSVPIPGSSSDTGVRYRKVGTNLYPDFAYRTVEEAQKGARNAPTSAPAPTGSGILDFLKNLPGATTMPTPDTDRGISETYRGYRIMWGTTGRSMPRFSVPSLQYGRSFPSISEVRQLIDSHLDKSTSNAPVEVKTPDGKTTMVEQPKQPATGFAIGKKELIIGGGIAAAIAAALLLKD